MGVGIRDPGTIDRVSFVPSCLLGYLRLMYRQVPNQLTVLRLVLSAVFLVALNQYRYSGMPIAAGANIWLWLALSVFLLASLTDVLDGHLARKWQVESTFGRIMDPFCDKVLVLGAFIYLAGPRFAVQQEGTDIHVSVSSVYPWMVAVMLARELLVTGVRGELEGTGVRFGATIFGKTKMTLQSTVVPVILGLVSLDPMQPGRTGLITVLNLLMYVTVAVTVISGVPYVVQGAPAFRDSHLATTGDKVADESR